MIVGGPEDLLTELDTQNNPWQVEAVTAFSFFCCPECDYRSKTVPTFKDHAVTNHPQVCNSFFMGLPKKPFWNNSGLENIFLH
jgi:hypothetical protein